MSDEPNAGSSGQPSQAAAPAAQPAPQTARQDQAANPRADGYSPAKASRAAAGGPQDEPKIKVGDAEFSSQAVRDALASKVEADLRASKLPTSPTGYKLDLPANFKAPDGIQVEFKADDPLLLRAREIAHARKIDQESFSDLLGVYAGQKVAEAQIIERARTAELAKLGSAAESRLNAVTTWLDAKLGKDKGRAVAQMLVNANIVEGFEDMVRLFSSQGGTQFSQQHREQQQEQGKIPGYENMSFLQRRAAQDANAGGSGPKR